MHHCRISYSRAEHWTSDTTLLPVDRRRTAETLGIRRSSADPPTGRGGAWKVQSVIVINGVNATRASSLACRTSQRRYLLPWRHYSHDVSPARGKQSSARLRQPLLLRHNVSTSAEPLLCIGVYRQSRTLDRECRANASGRSGGCFTETIGDRHARLVRHRRPTLCVGIAAWAFRTREDLSICANPRLERCRSQLLAAERIIIGGPALAACETMVSASPNSTFEPLRQRSNSIARLRDSEMSQQYHGWIIGDSLGLLTRR